MRLRAVVLRGFLAADARAGFLAADARLAVEAPAALRAAGLRAGDLRAAVLRVAAFRVLVFRAAPDRELVDGLPALPDMPVISRSAASATASAIKAPSFVALAATLLAACDAVSAASRPASRIARRALGLALIAAAAAARPAASISLLIAALAILSTVLLVEDFEDVLDERVLADFAIAYSPFVTAKDTSALLRFPYRAKRPVDSNVKGTAAVSQRCPSTWSAAEGDGRSISFRR